MKKFFQLSGGKSKDRVGVNSPKFGESPRSSVSSWGSVLKLPYFNDVYGNNYLVDLGNKSFTKLHKACWSGSLEKVKKHIKKTDVNQVDSEKRTPLHLAAANAHKDVVWFLLGCKAKPNTYDSDGNTPLLKAILCRHDEIVQFLLDRGADPKASDREGNTGLHLVAQDGRQDLAVALIQKGVDINAQNKGGFSPLMIAAQNRQLEMAELLIRHGASVNILDKSLRNCLMVACESGDASLTRLFLDHGVSVTATDIEGLTAEQVARDTSHHECLRILHDFSSVNGRLDSTTHRRASRALSDLPESEKLVISDRDMQDDISRASAVDMDADFDDDDPLSWNDDPSEEILPKRKNASTTGFDLSQFLPESDHSVSEASRKIDLSAKPSVPKTDFVRSSDAVVATSVESECPKEITKQAAVPLQESFDSDNDTTNNSEALVPDHKEPIERKLSEKIASTAAVPDQLERDLLAELGLDDDLSEGSVETDSDMSLSNAPSKDINVQSPQDGSYIYSFVPSTTRRPSATNASAPSSEAGATKSSGKPRMDAQSLDSINPSPSKPPRLFRKNSAPGVGKSKSGRPTNSHPANDQASGFPVTCSANLEPTDANDSHSTHNSPRRVAAESELQRRDSNLGSLQTVYVSVRQDGQFGPGTDESDWGDEEDSSADNAGTIHLRPVVLRKPSLENVSPAPPLVSARRGGDDDLEDGVTADPARAAAGVETDDIEDGNTTDPERAGAELEVDDGFGTKEVDGSEPLTPRSLPPSKSEGTLGRYGTLQEMEEVWETNALLEVSPASTLSSHDDARDAGATLETADKLYHADLVLLSSGSTSAAGSRQQTLGRDAESNLEREENEQANVFENADETTGGRLKEILDAGEFWSKLWQHMGLPRPSRAGENTNEDSSSGSSRVDSNGGSPSKESPSQQEASSADQSVATVTDRSALEDGNMLLCRAVSNPDNAAHVLELIHHLQASWQKEATTRRALNRKVRDLSAESRTHESRHRSIGSRLVESEGRVAQLASQLESLAHDLGGERSLREEVELRLARSGSQLQVIERSYMREVEEHQLSDVEAERCRSEAAALKDLVAELQGERRSTSDADIQTDTVEFATDVARSVSHSDTQTVDDFGIHERRSLVLDVDIQTDAVEFAADVARSVSHSDTQTVGGYGIPENRALAVLDAETTTTDIENLDKIRLEEAIVMEKVRHDAELKSVQDRLADLSASLDHETYLRNETKVELSSTREQVNALNAKLFESEKRLCDVQEQLIGAIAQAGPQPDAGEEQQRRADLLSELAASQYRAQSLSKELATARCRLDELSLQVSLLLAESQTRESTTRRLESEVAARNVDIAKLNESLARLSDELSKTRSDHQRTKLKLDSTENLARLRQQSEGDIKASWEEVAASIRRDYDHVEKQLKEQNLLIQDRCCRTQQELTASLARSSRLEQELSDATRTVDELTGQLDLIRTEGGSYVKTAKESERNFLLEKDRCNRLTEQVECQMREIRELKTELEVLPQLRLQLDSAGRDFVDASRLCGEVSRAAEMQSRFVDRFREQDAVLQAANARLGQLDASVMALRGKLQVERRRLSVVPELEKRLGEAQNRLQEQNNEVSVLREQSGVKDELVRDLLAKLETAQKVSDDLRLTSKANLESIGFPSEGNFHRSVLHGTGNELESRIFNSHFNNQHYVTTAGPPSNTYCELDAANQTGISKTRESASDWFPKRDQVYALAPSNTDRATMLEANLAQLQTTIERMQQQQPSQVHREPTRPTSILDGGRICNDKVNHNNGVTNSSMEDLYQRMDLLQQELSLERTQRVAKEINLEQQLLEARSLLERARQLQDGQRRSADESNSARTDVHRDCVERAEVDLLRQQCEIRSRLEFNESIGQIKKFLDEQSRASDRLVQLHNISETKLRCEYQQAVADLQREVGRLQENLNAKEMRQGALEEQYLHLSRLIEARRRVKGKLQEQQKIRSHSCNATKLLSDLRYASPSSRPSKPLVTSNLDTLGCATYPMSTSSVLSTSRILPNNSNNVRTPYCGENDDLLDYKLRMNLDRSINQNLNTGNFPDSDDSFLRRYGTKNIDLPHEKAAENYLKTLKRNYLL